MPLPGLRLTPRSAAAAGRSLPARRPRRGGRGWRGPGTSADDRAGDRTAPAARLTSACSTSAGFAASHESAAIQHGDAIAARFGLIDVVSRKEDRVAIVAEAREVGVEGIASGRVERRGRLVEKQDRRVVDESHREIQPLLQAARECLDALAAPPGQAESGEHADHSAAQVVTRKAVELAEEEQVIGGGEFVVEAASPAARIRSVPRTRPGLLPADGHRPSTDPSAGSSTPAASASSVLLPEPFGPSSPTISPRDTSRDTPSTARLPAVPRANIHQAQGHWQRHKGPSVRSESGTV